MVLCVVLCMALIIKLLIQSDSKYRPWLLLEFRDVARS